MSSGLQPMIPYGRQDISEADIQAVVDVLRSDWLTQGPAVPRFEQAVAAYAGAKDAVAVNSATAALHIACLALGVGPGDTVWTSPNTFVASANCALYCGASVDFVDIDAQTFNMSIGCLEQKLKSAAGSGKLPKVVIPVHFAGQPCDMPAVHRLRHKYGFQVIEDASHAIGASGWNSSVGSGQFSDITVFSFHPVKIITTGEGGMALANDANLAERMRQFRTHGITNRRELMQSRPVDEIWNYQQIELGYNYRMTDFQAALGLSQLRRLDQFVNRRHEIAKMYDHELRSLPVISQMQLPQIRSSYHLYPIRIRESLCGRSQRQVFDFLKAADIAVNLHYIPVYRQPYYQALGFSGGYCPEAELYHRECISLPMYSGLSDVQVQYVLTALKKALAV